MKYLALFVVTIAALAQAQGPLVFISGGPRLPENATTLAIASIGGGRQHDQTMELARDLQKSCPEVNVTLKEADPDLNYLVFLDRHEDAIGSATSQVMVLRPDKSLLFAGKKRGSVARATKDACKSILDDWRQHRPPTAAHGPPPNWMPTKP